jgi:HlyD family secretion protein
MNIRILSQPKNRQLMGLVIAATVVTGGIVYYGVSQFGQIGKSSSEQAVETIPAVTKVTALGRLEPEEEVIKLAAPMALDGDRVAKMLVKESERVKAGQVIAIMDSRDKLRDALLQAQKQVGVAQAKLAQVKAGAKAGEIQAQQATVERVKAQLQGDRNQQQEIVARLQAQLDGDKKAQEENIARLEAQLDGDKKAQEATIKRLEAELNNAQAEFGRYQKLFSEGAISSSFFDTRRLSVETARQQLTEAQAVLNRINTTANRQIGEARAVLRRLEATNNRQINEARVGLSRTQATGSKQVSEAKATLNSVAEVRPVDIQAAQAEVDNMIAAVKAAKTNYEASYIRAPMAGTILRIHTRPGEKMSTNGIADLAQTDQMVAVAEVYQSDVGKIKLGQQAVISGQAFEGEVKGKVYQVGLEVKQQNVFANQPGENLDRRIVEVKIRINPEDTKRVAGFTNLQVQTAIDI